MDSPYTWALGAMALIAVAFSYQLPNALLWIGLMTANFLVTTLFLDYGPLPQLHPWVACLCDIALAGLIVVRSREDWELGVAVAFITSAFVNLLRVFQVMPDTWVYPALLEICNAAALLVIMAPGILDRIGNRVGGTGAISAVRGWLHSPRRPL